MTTTKGNPKSEPFLFGEADASHLLGCSLFAKPVGVEIFYQRISGCNRRTNSHHHRLICSCPDYPQPTTVRSKRSTPAREITTHVTLALQLSPEGPAG